MYIMHDMVCLEPYTPFPADTMWLGVGSGFLFLDQEMQSGPCMHSLPREQMCLHILLR